MTNERRRIVIRREELQENLGVNPCPWCSAPHAVELFTSVRCGNPECRWHDGELKYSLSPEQRERLGAWLTLRAREEEW